MKVYDCIYNNLDTLKLLFYFEGTNTRNIKSIYKLILYVEVFLQSKIY